MDSTVRYLGVGLEDALAILESVEIWHHRVCSLADGPELSFRQFSEESVYRVMLTFTLPIVG